MLKLVLTMAVITVVGLSSTACTVSERKISEYGVGGAALGALAGSAIGGGTLGSVTTGAAVGAIAGTVTGAAAVQKKNQKKMLHQRVIQQSSLCTYSDGKGYVYKAPCASQTPQLCTYTDQRGKRYQAPCH
ncbi:glycine zipper domain-containing protein [Bartonella sp. AR 15-3]|uniref:glycine zipper domain-containing protein n=1 Tax=Bartonella sp. AR 15-3 TaxID=545617 RepID=UPI0001F4BBB9|nr:glycine zipper domain-containing protein [Bartonella sp. AR 15-3]OPB32256.1 hypothetical protein BAR153v2_012390 [Bartonella sp. AR 15-3]CBI79912.1 conserved membrane hypothetical protein [Bartonella sp. AR 15-3]